MTETLYVILCYVRGKIRVYFCSVISRVVASIVIKLCLNLRLRLRYPPILLCYHTLSINSINCINSEFQFDFFSGHNNTPNHILLLSDPIPFLGCLKVNKIHKLLSFSKI